MSNLWPYYLARYPDLNSHGLKEFYTNFEITDYHLKLPYMYDVEVFCLRLYKALLLGQKVLIYSDYDTDAVTATATMMLGLLDLGFKKPDLDFYAPDRFTEGYGMNTEAVDKLCKNYELIISVDCGINSVLEAQIVNQQPGCDLIITDHHHLTDSLPPALGVVNPRLSEYYKSNTAREISKLKFEYSDYLKPGFLEKIQEARNNQNFLPSTVTGVGVAWFCLVWLGYFLQEGSNT